MTEENKPQEKPVLDQLKEENERLERNLQELKEAEAKKLLGGKSEITEDKKEEEISDKEYSDRAIRNQL